MSKASKDNKKEMDISSAMDKIVEDTIGHIPVATPTPIKKIKRNRGGNKKTVNEELPKKEVELFFPVDKKAVPVKSNQKAKQATPAKRTKPSKTTEQQSYQDKKQQSRQTKAGKTKQSNQQPRQSKQQSKQGKQQPKQTQQQSKQTQQQSKQTQQQSKQTQQQPKQTKQQPKQTKQQSKQTKPQATKKTNQQQPQKNKAEQSRQNKKRPIKKGSEARMQAQQVKVSEVPKKKHKVRSVLLALLGMTLIGALGVYGYFAYYYYDKYMPGTYINQIDAHELNAAQIEEQIRQRVENYAVEIDFRGGKKETITGEDIDYAFASDGSAERILQEQNSLLWIAGYFEDYRHDVPESIVFDETKFKEKYNLLPQVQKYNQESPEDAYVFYQNQNWEIIPEVEGTTINHSVLYPAISEAIHASLRTCSAEEVGAYVEPTMRKESPELAIEARELNDLVGASITYKLPQGDEVLDGNMLKLWIQRDANGHYTKNEEAFNVHVESYVERLAEATDTVDKPKRFKMTGGTEVLVESKDYGWKIDRYTETERLKEELASNAKLKREPEYAKKEFSMENNGFGNTYIEVNLSLQHLYVYREGRLILESDIVSGRMTRSRWTPPGIFTLSYKQKGKILRGPLQPDGSYEWESPVTYWMPFNRGIGFHDATWRGSFGGTIYNYSGSHGCINMPYKKAQALYDIIDKDIPIICFYSENYNVR